MHARPRYATGELAKAIAVYGRGTPFSAGVDISEFGGAAFDSPTLPHPLIELAASSKPMVAAEGDGLVLAMACGWLSHQRAEGASGPAGNPPRRLRHTAPAAPDRRRNRPGNHPLRPADVCRARPRTGRGRPPSAVDDLLDAARAYAREGMQAYSPAQPANPRAEPGLPCRTISSSTTPPRRTASGRASSPRTSPSRRCTSPASCLWK